MQNQIMNYDNYDELESFHKIPKRRTDNKGESKGKKKRKKYDRPKTSDKYGTEWD